MAIRVFPSIDVEFTPATTPRTPPTSSGIDAGKIWLLVSDTISQHYILPELSQAN